jgi:flavin-dependent dehydrogenase
MEFGLVEYDVVIAGAGPAGVAAAITASKWKLSTLIVTGKRNPNSFKRIESVHEGVKSLLLKINCDHCLSEAIVGEYPGIETGDIVADLGGDECGSFSGHHIDRDIFDRSLMQDLENFPIDIIQNEKIADIISYDDCIVGVKIGDGREIISKYVIDATGYKKMTGYKLGLKEIFYSPPLFSWSGISNGQSHTVLNKSNTNAKFIPQQNGWDWVAPISGGKFYWTGISTKGKLETVSRGELFDFNTGNTIRKANRRWGIFRPLVKLGLILCGDAASVIDPAAGDGILNALDSGTRAAETIAQCISLPELEQHYLMRYDDWYFKRYVAKVRRLREYYKRHGIDVLGGTCY